MENTYTCTWCEEEHEGEYHTVADAVFCDECVKGVIECKDCRGEWYHADVGCVGEYDFIDDYGRYHCSQCAENILRCTECQEIGVYGEMKLVQSKTWNNGYKSYHDHYYCPDCYRATQVLSHDRMVQIAEYLSDEDVSSEQIIRTIQNNIDTKGTAWKLLISAESDEWADIVGMMEKAEDRHTSTNYDDLLASGISRDHAREYIS